MKALLALGIIFALIVAGCTGTQQAATGQQPPAGSEQQPAGNSPPSPPGGQIGMPVPGQENVKETEVSGTSGQAVKEFTIEATLWAFSPSTITVNKGDAVKLTIKNVEGVHGIYIPDYNVSLKAGAGETASTEFTADKAGTFPFRCNVLCGEGHTEMTGTLVVES